MPNDTSENKLYLFDNFKSNCLLGYSPRHQFVIITKVAPHSPPCYVWDDTENSLNFIPNTYMDNLIISDVHSFHLSRLFDSVHTLRHFTFLNPKQVSGWGLHPGLVGPCNIIYFINSQSYLNQFSELKWRTQLAGSNLQQIFYRLLVQLYLIACCTCVFCR